MDNAQLSGRKAVRLVEALGLSIVKPIDGHA
jgi:hypothetical protein